MWAILKIGRETSFLLRENCTIVLLDQRNPGGVLGLSKVVLCITGIAKEVRYARTPRNQEVL